MRALSKQENKKNQSRFELASSNYLEPSPALFRKRLRAHHRGKAAGLSSAVLAMLVLELHAATALLTTRYVAPQHYAPRFNTGQVSAASLTMRMKVPAAPEELLARESWTEEGFETIQGLLGVCQQLNRKRADAEHLGISLLADNSPAWDMVSAAGANPKEVRGSVFALRFQHQSSDVPVRLAHVQKANGVLEQYQCTHRT